MTDPEIWLVRSQNKGSEMRRDLVAVGLVFTVMWFVCWAATVVPGSVAVTLQWAAGNFLAFLAGGAFAAAFCLRSSADRNDADRDHGRAE